MVVGAVDLAALADVHVSALDGPKASGVIAAKDGAYKLFEAVPALFRDIRAARDRNTTSEASRKLRESQAKLNELKVAEVEGRLVNADRVVEAWQGLVRQDRQLFLSFPGRARAALPHLSGKDQEVLERLCHDMLTEVVVAGRAKGVRGE